MAPNSNYDLLITSCNRHDLLKQTLETYYAIIDLEPRRVIIYEDSDAPMPEWLKGDIWRSREVKWISGKKRLGQCWALAALIREAESEFVCWGEDDWSFERQIYPIIRESKEILQKYPNVSMVSLRGHTGWHPLVKVDGFDCWIAEPFWRGVWGGWSWNFGLRRRETLIKLLPKILANVGVKGLDHEAQLSKYMLDQGFRIADLGRPICQHLGYNRSRSIEELPPLPKILIAVLACHKFEYETHELHNEEKFHVNGSSAEQIQAVRETWAKDFEPFKSVDVKFFFGKPSDGYPRQPLKDEVFLECGDGYDSLIQKSTAICKWASEHGYDWMLKCDTDTIIYAERLLVELMETASAADYSGYNHASVASGGPGYWLSSTAMGIVATYGDKPRHEYAEDVHVSRVLAEHHITPLNLPNHTPGFSAHFFFGNPTKFDPTRLNEGLVTAHAIFPDQMRAWWNYKNEWMKPLEN